MIIKKKKAVIAAILSAALTVTAVMPSVSAERKKPEAFGDSTYAQRFLSLYDDVVTNGQENGYLSKNNVADGGFGIPYHSVEELCVEAPDYGHETTSEAMSYIVWIAAMRDFIGTQDVYDADGNKVDVPPTKDLDKAWNTMKAMIPTVQPGIMDRTDLSAQYSEEHDTPEEYPSSQSSSNTGNNPIHKKFVTAYGKDGRLFLMHWLADVDDWYGYGSGQGNNGKGKFTFINTFQRGAQESCWETVPHPCVENLDFGMKGTKGIKGIFSTDDQVTPQWAYTNAPDAEDRAIQAVYAANRWGVASNTVLEEAAKMGDQCRNNMFDKYYKEIGCENPNNMANDYSAAHYLMSWYTSWGGSLKSEWAWQIGASHCHEFYQNPLAAYGLIADEDLKANMKAEGAVEDYTKSLERQLEFYLWLQSEQGPIAGGATSSWHGRYLKYEYLADVDKDYIDKYKTNKPTTFYKMAYQEHPVYADPGSNHWIGNQVWAIQRLAEMYYVIKQNPTSVSQSVKAGGLSMEEALEKILDRWVAWFIDNVELYPDGDYSIPSSLNWFGQPKDWNGKYQESTGVTCEIVGDGNADFGCIASLCNTLIYYAKAHGVKTEAAYSSKNTDVAARGLYTAHALLDRTWAIGRDEIGVTREDKNGSMYRLFEQPVHIPNGYDGTMPNGDPLKPGATFSSIRSMYNDVPKYVEYKNAYESNNLASLGTSEADMKKKQEVMESIPLTYHRFWHAGDYLMALGTMFELYPDLQADKYEDGPVVGDKLTVDKESVSVEVGSTETVKPSISGSTFESADSSIATVSPDGTITGVAAGSTTVTVTSPDGSQKVTVSVTVTEGETIPTGSINPDLDYLYGDVDLNGAVELGDIVALSKYLASKETFPLGNEKPGSEDQAKEQANVAYDDAINAIDTNKLVEYNLRKVSIDQLGPGSNA